MVLNHRAVVHLDENDEVHEGSTNVKVLKLQEMAQLYVYETVE